MKYKSTRGSSREVGASEAILRGLAEDGGLYMPERIPRLPADRRDWGDKSYQEIAYEVLRLYLDDYDEEELRACIGAAYDEKFDIEEIVALVKAKEEYFLELFHGSTIAFKDMALSLLPHLLRLAAKKNAVGDEIVILTATSGDTGKAAMSGFADVPGTRIAVFYPKGGVSRIQELQMLTQKGENTHVIGIHGNFDDAQNAVKRIFADEAFAERLSGKGMRLSSANSINIGRLIPQIVYYVYAYAKLAGAGQLEEGEKINVCVPTGNFGNILAAYMAKQMGLPINKLICASNENKVLYDFFREGEYKSRREFVLTTSPSMDILISSNLERLIYLSCGSDAKKTADLMQSLSKEGEYRIDEEMRAYMGDFVGGFASEEECAAQIRRVYEEIGYVIDPHTAVASHVYRQYREKTGDGHKTLIAATASPYKFAETVERAIRGEGACKDEWEAIELLHLDSKTKIPSAIEEIRSAQIRHREESETERIDQALARILKI